MRSGRFCTPRPTTRWPPRDPPRARGQQAASTQPAFVRPIPAVDFQVAGVFGPKGDAFEYQALALELDALSPLHVETRSKSVRGYALAKGEPPASPDRIISMQVMADAE